MGEEDSKVVENSSGGDSAAHSNNSSENEGENKSETASTEEGGNTTEEGGEDKTELTEKGTKVDPDPKSAVHQELANAKVRITQMERVLSSPELLRKFAKDSGMSLTEAEAEIKGEVKDEAKAFDSDSFKTGKDVANAFNKISKTQNDLVAENKRLRDDLIGVNSSRRAEQIASTMQNDIATVREKYPELDPKSSEYDADLEKELSEFYAELDRDERTGGFRGKVSIARLADRLMKARGGAKKKGSDEAKTNIKTKQAGKVNTSSKSVSKETEDSKNPATTIAQRIRAAL